MLPRRQCRLEASETRSTPPEGAALRRLKGWLIGASQMQVGSKPYLHYEEGNDRDREKDCDEPFSVAGDIPVIHGVFRLS